MLGVVPVAGTLVEQIDRWPTYSFIAKNYALVFERPAPPARAKRKK